MINDPLYIASSDHPSMVLTNTPFNGSNFYGWNRNVRMALGAKLKLGFIDGSCPKPGIGDVDLQRWIRCDYMNINGLPTCDCGKIRECTCDVLENFMFRDSNSKLIHFLMKLNDEYESVRSQILAMDPLPTVNKAYYIVQHIEKQKQVTNHTFEPSAFFANMNNKGSNSGKKENRGSRNDGKRFCTSCNQEGHTLDQCFEKIGYPNCENEIGVNQGDGFDQKLVATVCQEAMKIFKGKGVESSASRDYASTSHAGQVIQNNQLVAHFYPNDCCFQDLSTNQIVAVGKGSRCLYIYKLVGDPIAFLLQNGRVERKHRHLLDIARALRLQANLPLKFWGDCILTATYLINKMPLKLLDWKSPYEKLYGKPPTYDHLRVIGCPCYAAIVKPHKDKFENRGVKCVLIGYLVNQKAVENVVEPVQNDPLPSTSSSVSNSKIFLTNQSLPNGYSKHNINQMELWKFSRQEFFIALATAKQWPLHQLDINNAFLHGYTDEEIYMLPPEGYNKASKGQVCKLSKSLYGLKQASRQWNHELTKLLLSLGYVQSKNDYSLLVKTKDEEFTVVLVYVDDMLITDAGLTAAKPSSFPLPTQLKFLLDKGNPLCDACVYRRLVRRLLYLTMTRPDIFYDVQHLSQFVSAPKDVHMQAAIHLLKYLKGTISKGLFYLVQPHLQMTGFSDAD
ncbi:retrovirus-related pol polyprotein from transposon TNT 1-94 [Tanacetum coccineum]|uniref:Retrovirus-related pol polyprotein from transposon TNT 1-94 n=1 Tax=Tanacetum coccineum TaxID=301880 RepID=A0ABQ5AKY3_9ASTR